MRNLVVLGATLLASVATVSGLEGCTYTDNHCENIEHEWCGWTGQDTHGTTFTNFRGAYSFTRKGLNADGSCGSEDAYASGPIAPLSNETHYVFRGPIKLSRFAVYQPGSPSKVKRAARPSAHERRHAQHQHFHDAQKAKRALGDVVTATIDGKVVTMTDTWSSPDKGAPGVSNNLAAAPLAGAGGKKGSGKSSPIKSAPELNLGDGQWGRTAFFDVKGAGGKPSSEGLAFLMPKRYTDQVTYFTSSSSGLSPSDSHSNLGDITVPDHTEFYIASAEECSDSHPCGMKGPNVQGHHGFKGDRVAVFEFSMPLSGNKQCDNFNNPNPDMPCIWALSSHVVNNLQYGECNGWTDGSGEHDIVEVLSRGSNKMFASMHMGKFYAGTEPNSFVRPTEGTMKLAVVYAGDTAHQQVLGDDFDFGEKLDAGDVKGLVGGAGKKGAHGVSAKFAKGASTILQLNQNP